MTAMLLGGLGAHLARARRPTVSREVVVSAHPTVGGKFAGELTPNL
jgi:hypothetical protein